MNSDNVNARKIELANLRLQAQRILAGRGERVFQWWLDECYEYPVLPGDEGHDLQYERSPLTREEEQEILDRRDRRLGRLPQGRLTKFVTKKTPGIKPRAKEPKPPPKRSHQTQMDAFMRKKAKK